MQKPTRRKFGENFLKLDSYAEPVQFNYDGGLVKFKTRIGSFITLLEICTVLYFAFSRLTVMASKSSTSIASTIEFPNPNTFYGADQNFTFAFGISTFTGSDTTVDIADYVSIGAQQSRWNDTVGESYQTSALLYRPCTAEDFGLNGVKSPDSKFFQAAPNQQVIFNSKLSSLQCIDQELSLQGNFNAESGQLANVVLTRCDSSVRSTCKSDAEVKQWLRDKVIYIVYNSVIFNTDSFDENTLTKVSVIQKTSININDQMVTPLHYIPNRLDRADSVWPGGKQTDEYYNIVPGQAYSFYQDPDMISGVSFQLNSYSMATSRTVLAFFNVAAQVGGFSRLAKLLFILMLVLTRTWGGEKYLVSKMYKLMLSRDDYEQRVRQSMQANNRDSFK